MKLLDLLYETGIKCPMDMQDTEITGIAIDSRKVKKGNLFVCMKGYQTDGHIYAIEAAFHGAAAVVTQDEFIVELKSIPILETTDTRKALSQIAKNFYGDPSRQMSVFAITGTNGKTTTTYMLKAILEEADHLCGVIGTVGYRFGDKEYESSRTTPESFELQRMFCEMQQEGIKHCAMEVSSHGLALHRVDDVWFSYTAFTNLTQDHMDFHSSEEDYYQAKKTLFHIGNSVSTVNIDDAYGNRLYEELKDEGKKVYSYSLQNSNADFYGEMISNDVNGCSMLVFHHGENLGKLTLKTPGLFTLYNTLCASSLAILSGITFPFVQSALLKLEGVPGRFELVPNEKGIVAIVDYAHTPEALRMVLKTAKDFTTGRLICVFGCGGDRDKSKRPIMGEIAGIFSDFCVITSDNPRTEDQKCISEEIEKGLLKTGCSYTVIENRMDAIKKAVSIYEAGDVIVIAGKGHECYQIIGSAKNYFNDKEIAQRIIQEL